MTSRSCLTARLKPCPSRTGVLSEVVSSLNPMLGLILVHRSYILRQHECEGAGACRHGTGQRAAAEDFYRGVVRKGEMVVGGAERFAKRLELLVSANELDRIDLGG